MPISHFSRILAVILALGWVAMSAAQACPGCSKLTEIAEQVEPQTVMAGVAFSWSVLFMLVVVLTLGGFMTVFIAKTAARIDRENAQK